MEGGAEVRPPLGSLSSVPSHWRRLCLRGKRSATTGQPPICFLPHRLILPWWMRCWANGFRLDSAMLGGSQPIHGVGFTGWQQHVGHRSADRLSGSALQPAQPWRGMRALASTGGLHTFRRPAETALCQSPCEFALLQGGLSRPRARGAFILPFCADTAPLCGSLCPRCESVAPAVSLCSAP